LHKFHNYTVPIGKERIDDKKMTSRFALNQWVKRKYLCKKMHPSQCNTQVTGLKK
jgi:hypothetical protein